jgi:hypothetical protein
MDPYRSYNNILEARKSRQAWAWFLRQPLKNFLKEDGRTEGKVQLPVVAQISRCQLSTNPYNCTDCGTVFKTDLWGQFLCCKRYFSWLKIVIDAVLNFPEAK